MIAPRRALRVKLTYTDETNRRYPVKARFQTVGRVITFSRIVAENTVDFVRVLWSDGTVTWQLSRELEEVK